MKKGEKHSKETRKKISEARKGKKGYWLGKKFSEEHKRKISESEKGKFVSEGTKRKIGKANSIALKDRRLSKEHKRKIGKSAKKVIHTLEWNKKVSRAHKGKRLSEKHKEKLSKAHKGKKLSKEIRRKLSEAHAGKRSHFWRGGISFEPYSRDWKRSLKREIRERDKYSCRLCGKKPATFIHHIDYNKKNCNSDNLTTLCNGCHSKTNYNREYWINYLNM